MNKTLEISAIQYDFHIFAKSFRYNAASPGKLASMTRTQLPLSFPDDDGKADQRMAEYKKRLVDLENNIWNR
mgnify:CR=1 FL=1